MNRRLHATTLAVAAAMLAASCGGDPATIPPAGEPTANETSPAEGATDVTVRLLTHDSFNLSDEVLAAFTADTGIVVEVVRGGDAGAVLSQAILTKDNPLGDVIFGIDNISLGRALAAEILVPHPTTLPDDLDPTVALDAEQRAVPIDLGDVCLNWDRAAFEAAELTVPSSLRELAQEQYASRLVVEDPSTSSPGLAFLLASIAELGEDGWQDWWAQLRDGGVTVASGWEEAYYGHFSGGSGEGDKPLVVSYASSPAAEVLFGPDPDAEQAPTGVILGSCFRQVEFAGTLVGTEHPTEAAMLVDFLLSDEVQEDIPLQMFVFPVRPVTLPDVFVRHAEVPESVLELDANLIEANREAWVQDWVDVMLR